MADSHVRWLCAVKGATTTCNVFKRAVCAAVDAFAEYGAGEVGGFQIGEFSVKNYASQQTTGEELATAAALREKEDVMAVVTNIKEIAGDVLAGAKAFNEKRAAEQAEVIEDTAEKAE